MGKRSGRHRAGRRRWALQLRQCPDAREQHHQKMNKRSSQPLGCKDRFADARLAASFRVPWKPWFPRTRAAFCLFLCFRANQVISRPDRFDHDRTAIPTPGVVMDARRGSSAQLPEGVGRSRPLVSRTSGAGGASSPAMAGVISAGTEAIVGAGLADR
jgi:hypothetical protein